LEELCLTSIIPPISDWRQASMTMTVSGHQNCIACSSYSCMYCSK
jgi:hypothetical protein